MERKYRLEFDASGLYRLVALKSFGDVDKGELGGLVEGKHNLSHEGDCWVSGAARVYDDARVYGNAQVSGNAWVYGNAAVFGNAQVSGYARVSGAALVFGTAWVLGDAQVSGNARVYENARVHGNAAVFGNARVYGDAQVYGDVFLASNVNRGKYSETPVSIYRSDGYLFTLQQDGSILAGCRDFSSDKATEHWGDPKHHKHKESWAIVKALRSIHQARSL